MKLKEHVLDLLSDGARAHLITAFWEYLLLLELCRKLLVKDHTKARLDPALADAYGTLQQLYRGEIAADEGDFSERLLVLSDEIITAYQAQHGTAQNVRLAADEVTNLLHATSIGDLRKSLANYLGRKKQILVLFDNLDRGWAYRGLETGDILILRCLIDAARKVQREMRKADVNMSCIVFVRNDIYEMLMDSSPDFGKEARASLDWSDPDLLREMLRRRIIQNLSDDLAFAQAWGLVCASHYWGDETSQFLIDRSLMRPRQLLRLVGHCKSVAINLEHEKIEAEDISKGLQSYSNDLALEADRELADIVPEAKGLPYEFVGEPSEFSEEGLHLLLQVHGVADSDIERVVDALLYLGFLGVRVADGET